jgi:hypothetical protein
MIVFFWQFFWFRLAQYDIVLTTYSLISSEIGEHRQKIGDDSGDDCGISDDSDHSRQMKLVKAKVVKKVTNSILYIHCF